MSERPTVLAAERSAADRHARSVMVDNELLSRKPVISLRAADRKFPSPVESELIHGEGRSCSFQAPGLQVVKQLLEHGHENPVLPLVRRSRDVLNA